MFYYIKPILMSHAAAAAVNNEDDQFLFSDQSNTDDVSTVASS